MAEPIQDVRADLTWLIEHSGLTAADVGMFLDPPVSYRAIHFWTQTGHVNTEHCEQIQGLAQRLRKACQQKAAQAWWDGHSAGVQQAAQEIAKRIESDGQRKHSDEGTVYSEEIIVLREHAVAIARAYGREDL